MKHVAVPSFSFHQSNLNAATIIRFAVGGIWLAGAAWNALMTSRMSDPYGWLADDAGFSVWRWFFSDVVESQPALWTALLIAGEVTLGLLTLSRGRWAELGLAGGALFSIMLVSFGTPYTLMMAPFALLLIWLLRHETRYSLLDVLQGHHRLAH